MTRAGWRLRRRSTARGERLSKWRRRWRSAKVTPKASRVAAFIVLWAAAMKEEGVDEYHDHGVPAVLERERAEGVPPLRSEFRELWPEFETPNELARQIVKQLASMSGTRAAIHADAVTVMA